MNMRSNGNMNMMRGNGGSGNGAMGNGGYGGGAMGNGGYGGGGGAMGNGSGEESYISYANLLKENFEGTSLDNLDSSTKKKESESKSKSKREINKEEEEDDELVDLIKDNIINNNEIIKKNKKGIKKIEKKTKSFLNINYKEFALLFFVYFLLSQEMIKDGFALYFTSLNPDNSGRIGVKGVIIYGLLLTTIFILLRNYLL